jgi:hypothetical protein
MVLFLAEEWNFCIESANIWQLVGIVINIFKIAIPIIIVLLGMLDLGKAVMASKDDEIKAAQGLLVKRLIYGVVIFFVVTLVQLVFGLVGGNSDATGGRVCWDCATNPQGPGCKPYAEAAAGKNK